MIKHPPRENERDYYLAMAEQARERVRRLLAISDPDAVAARRAAFRVITAEETAHL